MGFNICRRWSNWMTSDSICFSLWKQLLLLPLLSMSFFCHVASTFFVTSVSYGQLGLSGFSPSLKVWLTARFSLVSHTTTITTTTHRDILTSQWAEWPCSFWFWQWLRSSIPLRLLDSIWFVSFGVSGHLWLNSSFILCRARTLRAFPQQGMWMWNISL